MRVVWMVRSRQITRKLAWWLALIGYDPRDHSLNQKLYLVYASIFWSIWFVAVFSLLAEPALRLLLALGAVSVEQAAAALVTLALLGWGLFQLWQVTRCSPFVFSENDAYLLCQAPVSSRAVALTWFLGDWFEQAAPFWAGAVILSIARVDFRLGNQVRLEDLPAYLTAGLQALVLVSLVQAGFMALVWAAGALRLQRDRWLTWQPGVLRLGIACLGLGLAVALICQGLDGLRQPFWQVVLAPLNLPLFIAFGAAPLASGLLVGLAWLGLGLAALAWAGTTLNLSRAAQETTQKELIGSAQRYGFTEFASQLKLTNRLGSGRPPSRLPVRPGEWILGWKDLLQSSRALSLSGAWGWLSLLVVSLGVWLVPEPGARGLALAIWSVMVGQRATDRLQKDLAHWSLLRLLPFSSGRLLVADLALPWALVVVLGWVSLVLAGGDWAVSVRLSAAILLPSLGAAVSLAAAFDLLRQVRSDMLLNGSAPQVSSVGGLLGILSLALVLGLWYGLKGYWVAASLSAALLAVLLALVFWHLASRRLQQIN